MTQRIREQRIHYKLDQETPVIQYELKAYNVPFAGNVSSCRETYVKGDRVLEYNIVGDMTLEQLISKPIFRDELVEYLFSFSKQLVSILQNGLKLNKVVLDLKFIYVKLSDFTVQLVYLPLDTIFPEQNVGEFMKGLLSKLVYAHTPAIECANQIVDYFDDHREFDVYQFNNFIKELRASSQLLIIQEEIKRTTMRPENTYSESESARYAAEAAARDAEKARILAESEAKRQEEEARHQAEIARQAEAARMRAEAARIEAEVARQKADEEIRQQSQTAILCAEETEKYQETEARRQAEAAKMRAEAALRAAEEERRNAEKASSMYADEVRRAREAEMKAEEARVHAEYEARRNSEEAKRQAEEARRRAEEVNRLTECRDKIYRENGRQTVEVADTAYEGNAYRSVGYGQNSYSPDSDSATTVLTNRALSGHDVPVIIRKSTGETIEINKQVFCIGKADQGVDYKITGNKSISRRHAYITSINGVNYLRDNNSTNHTYLNGQQVYSNMDVVIPNNSLIRLSNEEFVFKIE